MSVSGQKVGLMRHDADSKSIALSTAFCSGLPRVMGDRIQLQQVIINLLVNSIQAITQSGQPIRPSGAKRAARPFYPKVQVHLSAEPAKPDSLHDTVARLLPSLLRAQEATGSTSLAQRTAE